MDIVANKWSRRLWLAVLAVAYVLASATVTSIASAAPPIGPAESASQMLKAAIASATHEGSVRVTVHFFSGKTTGELIQDSARQAAVQTVAIGKERISIVLVDGVAYFSGNSKGLTSYFGLAKSVASSEAGRWISVSPTDSAFQSVTAGLTLSSAVKEVSPTGSILKGKMGTVNRRLTASVSGTGSANEPRTTLFIAAKGKPLPVEAVASSGTDKGESGEIVTFSRWGETVRAPTPSASIPISALSVGSPSTG